MQSKNKRTSKIMVLSTISDFPAQVVDEHYGIEITNEGRFKQ